MHLSTSSSSLSTSAHRDCPPRGFCPWDFLGPFSITGARLLVTSPGIMTSSNPPSLWVPKTFSIYKGWRNSSRVLGSSAITKETTSSLGSCGGWTDWTICRVVAGCSLICKSFKKSKSDFDFRLRESFPVKDFLSTNNVSKENYTFLFFFVVEQT